MELLKEYRSFINGTYVEGPAEAKFPCINPTKGVQVATAYGADSSVIDSAVNAAREAFKTFGKTSRTERAALLRKMADRIEENAEHLARAESIDTGKPIGESMGHLGACMQMYRYFASVIEAREEKCLTYDNGNIS